jgi:putative hydroxymethylpyrimidine transport system substrate-binding protein
LRSTRITLTIALALASGLLAAGCGEKEEKGVADEPQRFALALDFYVNPDHAGIYTALERGYFEEAGLDVEPQVPSDPSAPVRQVAAGQVDLAVSYEPEVVLARDEGLPVKAVAALVASPLTSLIWTKDSGLRGVSGLRGKTVATAGIPYQEDFLDQILDEAGLESDDVEQVDVGFGLLPAVLSGRADAMLGGFRNVEGVDLEERGKEPTVLPVDKLGIPTYDELVLVANEDRLEDDESEERIRLFIAALERGTADAVRDPGTAAEVIFEAGRGLDPALTRAETEATAPLLASKRRGRPYGHMDPREWERFAGFFADRGLIETRPTADDLLTNDLLPGEIPD